METPASLLERLRQRPDEADWLRLDQLYRPLIQRWLRRDPTLGSEAEDLVQEVMTVLVQELPRFERQREGSFRSWLRTIVVNRLRSFWRSRQNRPIADGGTDRLGQLEDPASALSREWDREHDEYVAHKLLEQIQPEFSPTTFHAFRLLSLEERKAADVAAELAMSVNAVLLAKSRVLHRLREVGTGLLD